MSGDKPETVSVHVTQHDFGVIRASLIYSYEFWKHVVEIGEYPENFDEGKAKELILMNQEVLEKINLILTMKPIPSPNVEEIGITHLFRMGFMPDGVGMKLCKVPPDDDILVS